MRRRRIGRPLASRTARVRNMATDALELRAVELGWIQALAGGAAFGLALVAVGCGTGSPAEALSKYREALETTLEEPVSPEPIPPVLHLPDRRGRRLEVSDQRIGPIDFLAIIGCPLSEVVAERNAPLGKVLVPTRRLAHELRVTGALEECLPTLGPERAGRLRDLLAEKRAELPVHAWNAVWLDRDLERYLSGGVASPIGGDRSDDAAKQLLRAARAIEDLDVVALEAAFSQLRDDPAIGATLRSLARATLELERVAELLDALPVAGACDWTGRRLARIFRERYVPLQPALGVLDRDGRDRVEAIAALFQATTRDVRVPQPMQSYRIAVLGRSEDAENAGLWARYRGSLIAHAKAWGPLLERCGGLPAPSV